MNEIEPFEAQQEFIDPQERSKRYYGYVSGVGAGKTFAGIVRTIHNMQDWNPGAMGAIIAPTRQMIVNVIIPEMRNLGLFDDAGWEYKSNYSDEPGIHTPEGSRALMLSADNKKTVERLRGLNLAWVWMDERTAIPNRAQEIAMQRLRVGEYRNLYITTTPKGKDSTYEFFKGSVQEQSDFAERELEYGTLMETEDRRAIVGVPTSANEHTPEDYKEAMEQDMPDDVRQQEIQGRFVEVGSGVFSRDMLTYIAPEDAQDKRLRTIVAVDPASTTDSRRAEANDTDYWGMAVIQAHPTHGKIYVSDTLQRRGMSLEEGVQWIADYTSDFECSVVVEANQSQQWLADRLRNNGIGTQPVKSTRNKENRLMDLSIPLENDTIQFVDWSGDSDTPDTPGQYYDELISEMLAFPEGNHDDLLDALWLAVDNSGVSLGANIMSFDPFSDGS